MQPFLRFYTLYYIDTHVYDDKKENLLKISSKESSDKNL